MINQKQWAIVFFDWMASMQFNHTNKNNGSFLNPEGKLQFSKERLNTITMNVISRIMRDHNIFTIRKLSEFIKPRAKDESTRVKKYRYDSLRGIFKVFVLGGDQTVRATYDKLTRSEKIAHTMNVLLDNFKLSYSNKSKSYVVSKGKLINGILPTLGDGKNGLGVKVPFDIDKRSTDFNSVSKAISINNNKVTVKSGLLFSEQVSVLEDLIENSDTVLVDKQEYLVAFPNVANLFLSTKTMKAEYNNIKKNAEFKEALRQDIELQFQELYDFLLDNEIITIYIDKDGKTHRSITEFMDNTGVFNGENVFSGKIGKDHVAINKGIISNFMYHLQANHIYGTHYAQRLAMSDNMVTDYGYGFSKRAKQFSTPGTLVSGGTEGVKILEYNDMDMSVETKTKSLEALSTGFENAGIDESISKKLVEKYNDKIDTGDGSGQMNLTRYIQYLEAASKEALYSEIDIDGRTLTLRDLLRLQQTYEEALAKGETPTSPDYSKYLILHPIKATMIGKDRNGNQIHIKYATTPTLLSQMDSNNPLYEIVKTMYAKGYSEAIPSSSNKTSNIVKGKQKTDSVDVDIEGAFEYVGGDALVILKTEEQFKKTSEKMPKQLPYNTLTNLNSENVYELKDGEKLNGQELMIEWANLLANEITQRLKDYDSKYVMEIGDKKIRQDLFEAIKESVNTRGEYSFDAMEMIMDSVLSKTPYIANILDKMGMTFVRNELFGIKFPGGSLYNVPTGARNKQTNISSSDLAFLSVNKDGKITRAEITVSPDYFIGLLIKSGMSREEAIIKMQNVEFQNAILDNTDLTDIIFYRTPHQAKSSSIPARIVGFTANGVYGQVIFNPFVLKQAGPDFDIDKTTLLTKDIVFDKKYWQIYSTKIKQDRHV